MTKSRLLLLALGAGMLSEAFGAVVPAATNASAVASAGTNAVAKAAKKAKRPARITAANTYYDHKEGVAIFTGRVYVDDEEYKMHADKAYVFTEGTNGLSRIVAIGHVAMTNDTKRAYGAKVSYHRATGMVVLHSGEGARAEVRDEAKGEAQVVRGRKIKFWVDSEQVEVIDADIAAPSSGLGSADLRKAAGR